MLANAPLALGSITVFEMADPAAAAAPPPAPAAAATPPQPGNRIAARAERRATAMTRLQSDVATERASAPAPVPEAPKPAAPAPAEAKPADPATEKPDPATERSLRQVEQARKKSLDEITAGKAELEVQRAEIARLRKEAEGKVGSIGELKKLSPTALLEALDHFTEDDHDILSRAAYARTKAGKTDPRAQAAAQEATRAQGSRAAVAEVAQLKATIAELEAKVSGEFTRRDHASFAEKWLGETTKAIPTDTPTFIAKLHANEPETARRELLAIGQELEKANDGEPPTHAEVIAEFEKRKRASLKSMGLDPDALLAPPKPAAPAAAAKPAGARTLDVAAANVTRPANAPKTRDERRDAAVARIRAERRTTADQA